MQFFLYIICIYQLNFKLKNVKKNQQKYNIRKKVSRLNDNLV